MALGHEPYLGYLKAKESLIWFTYKKSYTCYKILHFQVCIFKISHEICLISWMKSAEFHEIHQISWMKSARFHEIHRISLA